MAKTCQTCRYEAYKRNMPPCDKCFAVEPSMWEASYEFVNNPYWKAIEALAEKQRAKGISKYGQGLEMNPMGIIERLTYLEEELVDGLFYIEHIKAELMERERE